jgi:hypothetical protein
LNALARWLLLVAALNMVIVLLQGGMGRQMFQYAAALGALKPGETLYADLHGLYKPESQSVSFTPRRYGLGIFPNLNVKKVPKLVHHLFNSTQWFWWMLRRIAGRKISRIAQQRNKPLLPELQDRKRNMYLTGAFQNEDYFIAKRAQLLRDFAFPEPPEEFRVLAGAMSSHKDSVSVHVRRGDEPANSAGALSKAFYLECIAQIRGKTEQPQFYVFTDDPLWCKEALGLEGGNVSYVPQPQPGAEWVDMYLMSQCAHHFVANTSFSWWGAWLSQRRGLNFAPASWAGPGSSEIIPRDWVKV